MANKPAPPPPPPPPPSNPVPSDGRVETREMPRGGFERATPASNPVPSGGRVRHDNAD